MATRRMFSKDVIDSDRFLDMPLTVQALYFHLAMQADDDGFVGNPKKIQRMIGSGKDDISVLIDCGFIIPFNSGIIVITHWKSHNQIKKDRYKPTVYLSEKNKVTADDAGVYSLNCGMDTDCIQNGSKVEPQTRLDKYRLDKDSIDQPSLDRTGLAGCPSLDEVTEYFRAKGVKGELAERFYSVNRDREWRIDGSPVKNWKKLADSWISNEREGVKHDADGGGTGERSIQAGELDRRFGTVL